jgi:hypothetical protein
MKNELETEEDKLARWWNSMNSWEWPEDLANKPEGFDDLPLWIQMDLPFQPNKNDWMGGIMERIEKRIGNRACLRWHHFHNLGWTHEQHDDWWREHGNS